MSSTYTIPLTGSQQTLTVAIAGVSYKLRLLYQNVDEGGWTLDISDSSGNPVLCGIPLVTGADLLAQYAHLSIGAQLWVKSSIPIGGTPLQNHDPYGAVPTFTNLGTDANLYVVIP